MSRNRVTGRQAWLDRPDCPLYLCKAFSIGLWFTATKIFTLHSSDSASIAKPKPTEIEPQVCPRDMGSRGVLAGLICSRMTIMLNSRAGECQVVHYINMFAK